MQIGGANGDQLIGNGGVALIGLALEKIIDVKSWVDSKFPVPKRAIPVSHLLKSYVALLCQGERDFDKIEKFRGDEFFMNALGMDQVPSDPTLRQNLAPYANRLRPIVVQMSVAFLKSIKPTFERLHCGHVPIDIDVFTQDNSDAEVALLLEDHIPVRKTKSQTFRREHLTVNRARDNDPFAGE